MNWVLFMLLNLFLYIVHTLLLHNFHQFILYHFIYHFRLLQSIRKFFFKHYDLL